MDTKTANLINDKIVFSRAEKMRRSYRWIFFTKDALRKIYRATFDVEKIIIYEGTVDGGPLILFDLGNGIFIDIFDTSRFNSRDNEIFDYSEDENDNSTYFLGNKLIIGKQEVLLGKVSINFDILDSKHGVESSIHSVDFLQETKSLIDVHYIGHGYELDDGYMQAYGGSSTIDFAVGVHIDYDKIPNNSFEFGKDYDFLNERYNKNVSSKRIEINKIIDVLF